MAKKKSEFELVQGDVQRAIDKTNEKIEELGNKTALLYDRLNEIQAIFDLIRNIPGDNRIKYQELRKIRLNWKQQAEKIEKDFKDAMVKNTGVGAAGAGIGVAVAALGPSAAMGVATTFGVASTGTAISTLSGAAATNAALAWLGGGALAAGGGGMAAGEALLALAGPIGWAISGAALLTSGLLIWKSNSEKKHIEAIFTSISKRDLKSYKLAIVELNERIERIIDESTRLKEAIDKTKTFGFDYYAMSESQQYELGAYVNLMNSSTQLLVNPIKGLQPKYTSEDFDTFMASPTRKADIYTCMKYKNLLVSLANFLYKIYLIDRDKKLLWKYLRNNKELLESLKISKEKFDMSIMDTVFEALIHKYISLC